MLYNKIVVLDSVIFFPEHRERLDRIATTVVEYNTTRDEDVLERCQGADCIISCWVNIPNAVIDNNPQLKTIAFWTHDFEHRIDWKYARSRGIYVPAIPDYGTDSVAELVFIALLHLPIAASERPDAMGKSEEIIARLSNDVRLFRQNLKDTLNGRWVHEYVKTGQLRMSSDDEIQEDTLKGLTVGVIGPENLPDELHRMMSRGFRMNTIYTLADHPHDLDLAYRPIGKLLAESQILIYDSRAVNARIRSDIDQGKYLSRIDVSRVDSRGAKLARKKLGIVGLGRIGTRVAQIAREGFGMEVQYYSQTRKPSLEDRWGLRYVDLTDLLRTSDIVSLHLPHHGADDYVSDDLIAEIPTGSIILNASVGNVISREDLLLKRFERGELTGYLDVYRGLPPRNKLRELQQHLLATYRLGWRTKSTVGLKTHKLITKLQEIPSVKVAEA